MGNNVLKSKTYKIFKVKIIEFNFDYIVEIKIFYIIIQSQIILCMSFEVIIVDFLNDVIIYE